MQFQRHSIITISTKSWRYMYRYTFSLKSPWWRTMCSIRDQLIIWNVYFQIAITKLLIGINVHISAHAYIYIHASINAYSSTHNITQTDTHTSYNYILLGKHGNLMTDTMLKIRQMYYQCIKGHVNLTPWFLLCFASPTYLSKGIRIRRGIHMMHSCILVSKTWGETQRASVE